MGAFDCGSSGRALMKSDQPTAEVATSTNSAAKLPVVDTTFEQPSQVNPNADHQLLAIVAVDPEHRVRCGQPGCGHSVYARIHVVRADGELLVLGSTCFEKRYGSGSALGAPSYGGGNGRQLTPEERGLLEENTALLLAKFEQELAEERLKAAAQLEKLRQLKLQQNEAIHPFSSLPQSPNPRWSAIPVHKHAAITPFPWMKPLSSMLYLKLRDGTGWARVQHKDGQQFIVPWPTFEGWDEAFPPHIGTVDPDHGGYAVKNVASTVKYLRSLSEREQLCGSWRELLSAIEK